MLQFYQMNEMGRVVTQPANHNLQFERFQLKKEIKVEDESRPVSLASTIARYDENDLSNDLFQSNVNTAFKQEMELDVQGL